MLTRTMGCLFALVMLLVLGGCEPQDGNIGEKAPKPKAAENEKAKNATADHAPAAVKQDAVAKGGNLARIQGAKVIRIGIKNNTPPFCFVDKEGRPQGFDVDLGARIARELGVQPVFVTVTSAERIEKVKAGEVDIVIATLTGTRRRAHEVDFSLPYFEDTQHLLVKKDSPVHSYKELTGKKVAVLKNSTSILNLLIVAPDCKVVEVSSNDEGFEMLKKGEVDALTGDRLQLLGMRLGAADPGAFKLAGDGFSVEPYVIGLPRGDSELRNKIDEALSELWNKGIWTRIFNKWLGPETPYNLDANFKMALLPP